MRCPACGSECINHSCTVCGLENLNQVFMSREDKEKWINDIVKPLKQKYSSKVMVGGNTFFCLSKNNLWGWGSNNSKQLFPEGSSYIETPLLIAQNVISACASLNYVIYITQDGKVHYKGTEQYGIFERIPASILNEKFAKVYSDCKQNSIVLEFADKNRECLFLGYNDGRLIPRGELLHKDVTYKYIKKQINTMSGYYFDGITPEMHDIPEYLNMVKKYGSDNCTIRENRDDGKMYKSVTITVENKIILDPVTIKSEISTQYLWNGLPRVKDNFCQGSPYNEWRIDLEGRKIIFKHTANGDLQVSKNGERVLQLNSIMSFAASEDIVILVENSGRILHGETKSFIEKGIHGLEEDELDEFSEF